MNCCRLPVNKYKEDWQANRRMEAWCGKRYTKRCNTANGLRENKSLPSSHRAITRFTQVTNCSSQEKSTTKINEDGIIIKEI